ncbi:MAG: PfkB family carbohydrate kinase [Bifidobacteriaceae bacterium]|nr:PfkB family carbohydrate kinase [Bifidobacteriaceae bacterium]
MSIDVLAVGGFGLGVSLFVERAPAAGETVGGATLVNTPGGKASNQAVAASRLGAKTGLVSAVGPDGAGRAGGELWASEGVDAAGVAVIPGETMLGAIVTDATGENRIVVADGVLADLEPAHVRHSVTEGGRARIVLTSCEIPLPAVRAALAAGAAAGAVTILNPAPAPALAPADWANIDIVTPNQTEALALLRDSAPEAAGATQVEAAQVSEAKAEAARVGAAQVGGSEFDGSEFGGSAVGAGPVGAGPVDAGPIDAGPIDAGLVGAGPVGAGPVGAGPVGAGLVDAGPVGAGLVDAGPEATAAELARRHGVTVVMTLGAGGVLVQAPGEAAVHVPAFAAGPAVDTTGAGDAFNGAFAAGLAAGLDLVDAARLGAVCGGLAVTRRGVIPSLPTLEEATAALGNAGLARLAPALRGLAAATRSQSANPRLQDSQPQGPEHQGDQPVSPQPQGLRPDDLPPGTSRPPSCPLQDTQPQGSQPQSPQPPNYQP